MSYQQDLKSKERFYIEHNLGGDTKVVLAYPNRYWIAMSNLGFQAVFKIFSGNSRISLERSYLPEDSHNQSSPWVTFESGYSISNCEILAVSVSFETDYPYIIELLKNAGLDIDACREFPLNSKASSDSKFLDKSISGFGRPFILGGGAAITLNPEPLANFFDAIIIGEAEEVLHEFLETYLRVKDCGEDYNFLLKELSKIEGIYIPSFYKFNFDDTSNSVVSIEALHGASLRVSRRYIKNIDDYPTTTVIQTPETEFKGMFMTETGRGCEVGCKFCVAGYMYRPIRKRSYETIQNSLQIGIEKSDSIGFVGAAVSSHPKISALASEVSSQGKRAALSSIMSQKVTKELSASLSESEYKTVALAPEAGTEELRFRIGKRVTNSQVIKAIDTLAEAGIRNFKLYFMVGLPSESISDVEGIVQLVKEARESSLNIAVKQTKRKIVPTIFLSVNPFIPKAWTPFQRHPFLDFKEIKKRIEIVRQGIKRLPNVEMKFESPRESYFQTVMSRGDRRVGDILIDLNQKSLDWRSIVKTGSEKLSEHVPAPDFYVYRKPEATEILPWEVIDMHFPRSLLEREYEKTFTMDVAPIIERKKLELLSQE